jgi:hypothetical protein|tara:strand:- start:102 stop:275 length:174 start_codon:yes stop_codon:yes gene_type:complete
MPKRTSLKDADMLVFSLTAFASRPTAMRDINQYYSNSFTLKLRLKYRSAEAKKLSKL